MDEEDARDVELSSISAIYPDELILDGSGDPYSFTIELSVSLSKPLIVEFPATSDAAPLIPGQENVVGPTAQVESQQLSNLPSLQIHITLPKGYPEEIPPEVKISTLPPWLPEYVIRRLENRVGSLWEDMGRDQVIFTYIDDVQQSVDDVFGLVDEHKTLQVSPEHKIAILDYDSEAKRRAFEKSTFDCGICLGKIIPYDTPPLSSISCVLCYICFDDGLNIADIL